MKVPPFLSLAFLFLLGTPLARAAFKICAFNIKSFGEAKAANVEVMGVLVKILVRCDISLIQEVRDSKGEVVPALIKEMNRFDAYHQYRYLESKRLGRNSYKEQYVFIYRPNVVEVRDTYQYVEGQEADEEDVFARGPFIVRFYSPKTVIKDFVLVALHASPRGAAKEIHKLFRVIEEVRENWKTENIMLLGDLNAACAYLTMEDRKSIRLSSGDRFHWLIDDKADTTVRQKTHCAYDRIVVHGDEFLYGVVPGSAKPFNFAKKLGLSEEEALEVSDHFPVEVNLRPDRRTDREL
ncbi:deoxyribonuclease-1-like isoform X2 [Pleurodeles waltl]|uniref:deoxyribonuclease-1-like isoform X2 n=1 Tax=Pleurodeles waltl TaxID=8319 RepID=UPI0037097C87